MGPFFFVFMEFIEQATLFIQSNVASAPYAMFGLLLLAGFNLPVPEDLMLFISGVMAAKNPEHGLALYTGVLMGAYWSDVISYGFMGRYLGDRIFKIKFFSKMVTPAQIEKLGGFFEKYGVLTLVIGRFIPFGVRNAMFITAGITKMSPLKFMLGDLLACIISCSTYFYLYYTYGEAVVEVVKKGNIVIFSVFALASVGYLVKKKMKKKAL